MTILKRGLSRRRVLQTGMAGIIGSGVAPLVFSKGAWAQEFCNNPTGDTVVFGLNLPLTGTYAEEGADERCRLPSGVPRLCRPLPRRRQPAYAIAG